MTRRPLRVNLWVSGALFLAAAASVGYAQVSHIIGEGVVDATIMLFLVFTLFQVLVPAVFTFLRAHVATPEMRENIRAHPLSRYFSIDETR